MQAKSTKAGDEHALSIGVREYEKKGNRSKSEGKILAIGDVPIDRAAKANYKAGVMLQACVLLVPVAGTCVSAASQICQGDTRLAAACW